MPVYVNTIPNPSAEGSTASLENETASTVGIVTTTASNWPLDGTRSYSVTATATTTADARCRLVDRAATTGGKRWHLRAKIRAFSGNTGARQFTAFLLGYAAAPGATAGTRTTLATLPTLTLAPGEVADIRLSGVTAAGQLSVGAMFRRIGDVSGAAVGDGFHLDMLALVQADAEDPPLLDYWNPALVPLARWNGTANASPSTLYVPSLALAVFNDQEAPGPRIQINATDLPPFGTRITIHRTSPDELPAFVRDANRSSYAGTKIVEDVEAPIGVPVTYRAELFAGDVSLGSSPLATETIPVIDPLAVWIHDPLDPRSAVKGTVAEEFADTVGKDRDGDFYTPGGSQGGSVLLAGASDGYTGLNLGFYTDTVAQSRAFGRIRDQTPIAVLRTAAPIPIPRTLFVALLNPRSKLLIEDEGFTRWNWTSRQVLAPSSGVVVPLHSYADYMAFYPTYQAAMAVFLTYVDSILNPPPAV